MGVLTRLVVLCGTILVLDFTTVFCQSSALSTEIRKEHVCVNVDVRNSVNNFNSLKNCTVIEGFLQILLIDSAETREYERLSFPRLREITGYLLLYRVYNLRTLANIFPNLAVIRGRMLFYNYALVAYEMNELQNLGLSGLTTIEKGAVRFEKNSHLCYLDTINWDLMTINRKDEHFFKDNRGSAECANVCPKNCPIPPKSTSPVCWNSDKCQIVPVCKCKYCYGDQCCHPQCIGGCSGPTQRDCIACQRVFHHGVCLSSCPNGTYEFRDRRCLTTNECISMDSRKRQDRIYYKTHQGKCLGECPPGYRVDKENLHKCTQCEDGKCPKICPHNWISSTRFAEIIDSVTSAAKLTGCNIVMANLEITISGGKNIAFELEKALGEIEEVHGYVKVARSYALISLSFFKKLRLIKGSGNRGLQMDKNAFVLLENTNLQEIWNLDTHPPLTIERGSMFFHYNRKLCLSKIDAFFNKTNTSQVRNEKDISRFTNGDEAACFVTKLKLEVMQVMSEVVIIKWTKFDIKDDRNLLSYVISYREAPTQDISILDGKDACSSNVWKTMDHQPVGHSDNTTLDINELIYNLKPYTQYAIYVQTYTISTAKQGAISNLVYFTTTTKEPTVPENVRVIATSEGLLKVSWKPPKRPNGNVTHYVVFYRPQLLDPKEFDKRNYCNQKLTLREKSQESRDKTETVSNVTVKDGQCCTQCPKTKEERERDELETQIQIRFENFLQSMVFQKRPDADSRRRRDVPYLHDPAVNGSYNPSIHATTIAVMVNGTEQATTPPTVKEEPKEIVWKSAIVYNKLETFLTNLKQFTIYNIQVIACHDMVNDVKRCSNSALATRQTLPKPKADNIPVNNITVTNINHGASQSILIKWLPPPDPNGLILLYEVEYQKIEDYARLQEKCIPHIKYTEVGGYQTPDLESGNYSLRLRVTSLAGNGSWTDLIYFSVAERPKVGGQTNFWTPTVIGLVVSAMILILIISVAGVVFYFKRREAQRVPDSVLYASVNPDYWPGDVYVKDGWEVDRDKVQLLHELGQGSFGMVYEGVARELDSFPDDVKEMRIAVKTVNENASMRDRIEFLNEASVMKAFNNYHVVRLLGVVSEGQPSLVIMELMAQGDLKNYLRMHRPDEPDNEGRQPPSLKEILQMSAEIADGMAYLVAKKYVHRDLAARNCMVDEYSTVKIGDFGMTRDVYETDYYRKGGKGLLPVRWMSPESLKDGVFTSASDVWSYGVVLWEMATLAAQPYQGLANEQVLKYVVDGGLMEIPEGCPQRLYDLMMLTWQYYPKQRPTFQDIISTLVTDVDEHFREVSYYHSQENQDDLAKEADKVSSGDHGELEGLMDDSQLPLAPTDANNVKNDRTSNVRFANGEVYGIRGSGLNGHDSRVGSSGDNQSLAKTNSVVELGNYNCLDLRRDSSLSRQTGSAIHSDDTGGGSKESSTSKSSSGSSHRNGFVNGHAHMPKSSAC